MTPRALLTQLSAGRIALGVSLIAAPRLVLGIWLGEAGRHPAVGALGRGFGARDAVLGAGTLAAMRSGQSLRPWLIAGLVADATDFAATALARDRLPPAAAPMTFLLAGGAFAIGAANVGSVDDSVPA